MTELEVHSSLRSNCNHQIVLAKFTLKINYAPPYEHEVWNFKKANGDHIRQWLISLGIEHLQI